MFQNVNKTREGDHHATVDDLSKACIYENMRREQHCTKEDHAISERPLLRYKFSTREEYDEWFWQIKFESGAGLAGNE
jgi:hypothetical protein